MRDSRADHDTPSARVRREPLARDHPPRAALAVRLVVERRKVRRGREEELEDGQPARVRGEDEVVCIEGIGGSSAYSPHSFVAHTHPCPVRSA